MLVKFKRNTILIDLELDKYDFSLYNGSSLLDYIGADEIGAL